MNKIKILSVLILAQAITSNIFIQSKNKNLEVVKFYATWCSACQRVANIFDDTQSKYPELLDKVEFIEENIEENRKKAEEYKIAALPTFVFIKDGQEVAKKEGTISHQELKSLIDNNL